MASLPSLLCVLNTILKSHTFCIEFCMITVLFTVFFSKLYAKSVILMVYLISIKSAFVFQKCLNIICLLKSWQKDWIIFWWMIYMVPFQGTLYSVAWCCGNAQHECVIVTRRPGESRERTTWRNHGSHPKVLGPPCHHKMLTMDFSISPHHRDTIPVIAVLLLLFSLVPHASTSSQTGWLRWFRYDWSCICMHLPRLLCSQEFLHKEIVCPEVERFHFLVQWSSAGPS